MLGKLMKHELKATSRWFLPLFGVALIMAFMARLTRPMTNLKGALKAIPNIFTAVYVFSVIAIVIVTIILIVYRFYRNMVTDEGYLMHTLPVSATSHVVSKLLIAALWTVLSVIVMIASILIMVYEPGMFKELIIGLRDIRQLIGKYLSSSQMTLFMVEMIVLLIISIFSLPLTAYSSIAIGQIISKNKIGGAVVGFIIVSIASNVFGTIGLIPFISNMETISYSTNYYTDIFNGVNGILQISFLITVLFNVALFFITTYIFKKKLNLE